jgi:hypothetical protein
MLEMPVKQITEAEKKTPMEVTTTARKPFEKCALDIVGPLAQSSLKNKCSDFSRRSEFVVAIPIDQDAETIAREFVLNIVLKFGTPRNILTDQGSNFISNIFKETCQLLKIKKTQCSAFHPESIGSLERSHRVVAEYLRHYVQEDQSDWDTWIPYAIYVYKTTVHTSTGYTLFKLVYGFKSQVPSALKETPSISFSYDDYIMELNGRLQTAHEIARQKLLQHKIKSTEYYDKDVELVTYEVGQKILLHDETVRRGRSRKLSPHWAL